MRKILFLITMIAFFALTGSAQKRKSYKPKTQHVRGYTTKKGKRVSSYKRSRKSSYYIMPLMYNRRKIA